MYKAVYYVYIIAKNTIDQRKKIIFQMVNHTVFLLFSLYLYRYVYELLPAMGSKLPFANAIWSMSMYFAVFWLGLRNIEKLFRQDILSGNVEMYLLRPIGYIWQKVLMQIGQGLFPFVSALTLCILVGGIFVGMPEVNMPIVVWILALIVIFVLSQVLTCFIMVLCGLSGFWLENSEPMYYVVGKFIMIFGGAWVPVAFFPKTLQIIAEFSPFGASMSLSYAMYPNFGERFFIMVLNILFWIVVMGIITQIVSRRATRKLSVNG